jgi:hypothetical protein
MHVEVRIPNGEAAEFEDAAGRRLNGNLYVLSAWLDSPIESLEALPNALCELFAAPETAAASNAAGDDMYCGGNGPPSATDIEDLPRFVGGDIHARAVAGEHASDMLGNRRTVPQKTADPSGSMLELLG